MHELLFLLLLWPSVPIEDVVSVSVVTFEIGTNQMFQILFYSILCMFLSMLFFFFGCLLFVYHLFVSRTISSKSWKMSSSSCPAPNPQNSYSKQLSDPTTDHWVYDRQQSHLFAAIYGPESANVSLDQPSSIYSVKVFFVFAFRLLSCVLATNMNGGLCLHGGGILCHKRQQERRTYTRRDVISGC